MIRVMLVDDHAVVREGYRRLLELQDDLRVVAEAADAQQAMTLWRAQQPTVAVIDLALPGQGGLELIQRLRQRDEAPRCLAFSMHRDPIWAVQALRAGALGYVTKSSPPDELVHAVREVAQGRRVLSSDLAVAVATALLSEEDRTQPLSPREFEVFRLLLGGHSPRDIAEQLHLSPKTVHNLHYQIRAKLGGGNDFDLARLAHQHGWLDA